MLIKGGRRLLELSAIEMLNLAYAMLVSDSDDEHRKRIDLALAGKIGESGGEIVADPDLPDEMQGLEAPSWWNSDHDPFADQHQLGSTDASFHGVA